MSNFIFNDHGVCTNPKRVVIVHTDRVNLVVKLCELPIGWISGYDYSVRGGQEGGMSPVMKNSIVYPTEGDAIRHQLEHFETRYPDYFGATIREYLSPKTLQLF